MTGGRPQEPNDPSVMASIEEATTSVPQATLVGVIWRWRWELCALAVIAAGAAGVAIRLGPAYLAVLASITAALVVCSLRWPRSRRWIVARAWCMVTPHRIRTGCLHAWIQTRSAGCPSCCGPGPPPTARGSCCGAAPASQPATSRRAGRCWQLPAGQPTCASMSTHAIATL
jgi:hypothetical protein